MNLTVASSTHPMHHPIGQDQIHSLGAGLGRITEIGKNKILELWNWWNKPSQEQITAQRQIKIFRHGVKAFIPRLDSALCKIRKNPKDSAALKRIQKFAKDNAKFLTPHERADFQKIQIKQFKQLEQRLSTLQPEVIEKLKSILPILFQNTKNTETKEPKPIFSENKKTEQKSPHATRDTPPCTLSFDLSKPDPTKFFILSAPQSQPNTGFKIARIGVINGKTVFAISDPAATAPGAIDGAGKVWFIYAGPTVSSVDLSNLLVSQGVVIYGPQQFGQLGFAIESGDFNANGKVVVALGAPNNGGQETRLYLLFDPLNTTSLTPSQNCAIIPGESIDDLFGSCLAKGDVGGDGIPDLLVGAPNIGKFFGILGRSGSWSQFNLTQLNGLNGFVGKLATSSGLGCPIAIGLNQNNPIAGFAVSASQVSPPGVTNGGTFYVFNGRNGTTWPAQLNFTLDGSTEGFSAYGKDFERAGVALNIGGDFDQDGKTDIIATTNNGKLYTIYRQPDPSNTPVNLGILNGTNLGNVIQGPAGSRFGASIALVDINNDGNLDMAVGMPNYSPTPSLTNSGGIVFILGQTGGLPPQLDITASTNSSIVLIVPGVVANERLGGLVANLGDVDGDGFEDLGVTCLNSGKVYIIKGQPFPLTCPTTTTTTTSTTSSSTTSTTIPPSNNTAIIAGVVAGVGALAIGIATFAFLYFKQLACFAKGEGKNRDHDEGYFDGEL